MKYHYLKLYHDFGKPDACAKSSLLYEFGNDGGVESFSKAIIEFKDYSFQEYPDQEEIKAYIRKSYLNKKDRCYYWCGTPYYSYEDLYQALSEQKRFLSLEIEVIK